MKHYLCTAIYKDGEVIREDFEYPDLTPEDFEPSRHMGIIFSYPEIGKSLLNGKGVKIWQYCKPESKDEEEKLVSIGKWISNRSFEI